jgi:hypothetical protein
MGDLSEAVGDPSSVNGTQGRHQGNALRTFGLALRRLRRLDNDVGLCVCEAKLVCMCARNVTVAGLVGVDLLDYGLGNRRATGCERPVADAHSRGAATPRAVRYNLDLVRHGILGAFEVGVGARHLAMRRLVIYTLDSCDWNR